MIDAEKAATLLINALKENGLTSEERLMEFEQHVEHDWLPTNGARMVAKAWVDPDYKLRLLADGKKAAAELGFSIPRHHNQLIALENTDGLHNVICCSLCSCTAFTIVGMAPGWYKSLEYRSRIVREGRRVLAEFGLHLPESMKLKIWDTTADHRYMVLPLRPPGTEGWGEERLARLITQDSLIGVARLEPPFAGPVVEGV